MLTKSLTLPIAVGKKYVQRNGDIVSIDRHDITGWVGDGNKTWKTDNGSWSPRHLGSMSDLVADYIEPAKGHPHAALMAEFAKDAEECETPWERWQWKQAVEDVWRDCDGMMPSWSAWLDYRRKPTVTPDPHAQSAAEYAKDMAVSDKAWEGWEVMHADSNEWNPIASHPMWFAFAQYRRRPA